MRIAITNPTDWPYVRRGAERFINEFAAFLSSRGHDVTVVSAKPGRKEVFTDRGYRSIHYRRLWHPVLQRLGILEFHAFFFVALFALLRGRYDVTHCLTFMDALAARVARFFTGTPYVFLINGLPPQQRYYRTLSARGALFKWAVLGADEVICLSEFQHDYFEQRFGRGGLVVPGPVDMDRFHSQAAQKPDHAVIFCAAALEDSRKGGRLLMKAFNRLKESRPDAVLRLGGAFNKQTRENLLEEVSPFYRQNVEFIDTVETDPLPVQYAEATISVLPAVWEAFGLVIIESLASGTPVVGTHDSAIPEVLSSPEVGRLFDPGPIEDAQATNVDGLAEAMLSCIELSEDPRTRDRCRGYAEQFAWSRLGPRYEAILQQVVSPPAASPVPDRIAS